MTDAEIYEACASEIRRSAEAKSCIVCNYFRTCECPQRKRHWQGMACHKFEFYLGRLQ
jgi:hypothetical protein